MSDVVVTRWIAASTGWRVERLAKALVRTITTSRPLSHYRSSWARCLVFV
jgi:hypothetical protein